jgi:hypothetical protein
MVLGECGSNTAALPSSSVHIPFRWHLTHRTLLLRFLWYCYIIALTL